MTLLASRTLTHRARQPGERQTPAAHRSAEEINAGGNAAFGILANVATIAESVADNNGDTCVAATSSAVRNCVSTNNTGSGIVVSSGSRVSGCLSTLNDFDGITMNSDRVALNIIGDSNAIGITTGNSGGTAPGSTDHSANFSY